MNIALNCPAKVLNRSPTLKKALNFPRPQLPYLERKRVGDLKVPLGGKERHFKTSQDKEQVIIYT